MSTADRITQEGYRSCSATMLPPGAVLFSSRAPIGLVAIAGIPVCTNQGFKSLIPGPDIDTGFLFWCLRHEAPSIAGRGSGSTFAEVSKEVISRFEIQLPPFAEQRRIAAVLDKADAIRRKRRESQRLLDAFLRSEFLEMFGDPVRNEKGWELVRLEAVSGIVSGVTKGRKFREGSRVRVPYLRVANVQDGYVDLTEVKTIEATADELEQYELRAGDILLTEGGDPDKLGRGAVWRGEIEGCIHQNHVFRVRLKNEGFVPDYVSALLGSSYGKRYFLKAAKQTTGIASINRTQLGGFPVLAAPPDRQQRYAAVGLKVREVEARVLEVVKATDNLFDSLAQRAFRGEL